MMDFEAENESLPQWNTSLTRLLLSTRIKYENEFRSGKIKNTLLWNKILHDMKQSNSEIKFTTLDLTKKFNNLMITYKRIKLRSRKTGGQAVTTWPYFDTLDEVYSDSYKNLSEDPNLVECSSLNFNDWSQFNDDEEEDVLPPTNVYNVSSASHSNDDKRNLSGIIKSTASTSGLNMRNSSSVNKKDQLKESIFNYLKDYDAKVERRHRQTLKIEIKKIKIEEDKLKVLTEIRDLLKEKSFLN